ncbi:MAG: phosphopantothenoylcysteine decarboxylase [Candidatus Muproteobacteria bacterium RBG_16_62_13]|uniref:Coenzyme A biosynthesis bifunctional protein CoaBC n=1 Tax=Candidatus Muproteobacteria bacterium RBG_16_62_13 TaxID=1817756 RepID=A0A1F6T127_9PROT|nr:MAG: phosphopantothenoylcysteine decarboxylase [Candidatus Muproteobacteria bacterium RBG_16_62_13]
MASLTNKRILLGITGGIAAYKTPDLVRRLREAGAEVRCVLTRSAHEFVTPLTLHAVSDHPVYTDLFGASATHEVPAPATDNAMEHIALARWADAILVAPASADFLARLVHGRADDLLASLCLAASAPLAVAPAMNRQMWAQPATQSNLTMLRERGVRIFGPADGVQACGETGPGRLLEPNELASLCAGLFETGELEGLKMLITAGPTWEAIDPVRGISNRSSGKMGYALATAAMEAGAHVTLISGPTTLPDPDRVRTLRVTSAQDMHDAVHREIPGMDIFIGVAAVADYRPVNTAPAKIKKTGEHLNLELERTPDILASVAALKPAPFMVGFAAETENLEANARAKLLDKKLDLVAANPIGEPGAGPQSDTNRLLLVDRQGSTALPAGTKSALARMLIHEIAVRLRDARTHRQTG